MQKRTSAPTIHQDSLDAFKRTIIKHPILEKVDRRLHSAIAETPESCIITLYGPTGVGKSTVAHGVMRHLIAEASKEMESDPGYIPAIWIHAVASSSGVYSMKDHYARCLEALLEPMIDRKHIYGPNSPAAFPGGLPIRRAQVHEQALRHALKKCLSHRRTKVVFIDEAPHMLDSANPNRRLTYMNVMKSLAEDMNVHHVLIGTYELSDALGLSAQLCRREYRVHFPRYRRTDPADHHAYASVLATFERCLSPPKHCSLLSNFDYFYERSLGCVGLLKSWVLRAAIAARDDRTGWPQFKHFEQSRLPEYELVVMAREIARAEEALGEDPRDIDEIRRRLDGEPPKSLAQPPRRRKSKVGVRTPVRDPVMVEPDE